LFPSLEIHFFFILFILFYWQIPNFLQAQQTNLNPDLTSNKDSKLVLNELWTKNFGKNAHIFSAYILLGVDQKLKTVIVNTGDIYSIDLNGNETKEETSKDGVAFLTSRGKRIIAGNSSWRMEDSEGKLIKKSSDVELLEEGLIFSPDDSLILGRDEGQNAELFDGNGDLVKKFGGKIGCVGEVCFSPNSQFIGLGSFVTNKPGLENKFWMVDRHGELIFELSLDSQVRNCSFNEDGTRISVVTWKSLYLTDLKGNIIRKIAQLRGRIGLPVFINTNLFIATSGSNIWKVDISSDPPKYESIQKIGFPRIIGNIGSNFAIDYGVEAVGPYSGTDLGLEIISSSGKILASTKLPSSSSGSQLQGNYIALWSDINNSLKLFEVSTE